MPAPQLLHTAEPGELQWPGAQHTSAPARLNLPAAQGAQLLAPAPLKVFAAHVRHCESALAPAAPRAVPAGQGVCDCAPAGQ